MQERQAQLVQRVRQGQVGQQARLVLRVRPALPVRLAQVALLARQVQLAQLVQRVRLDLQPPPLSKGREFLDMWQGGLVPIL